MNPMKWIFVLVAASAGIVQAQTAQQAMQTPRCNSNQLSLTFDDEHGSFDGMSQGGTLLVLRNIASTQCSVLPRPELTFEDAQHKPVAFVIAPVPGMHPGPVQIPVVIPPTAEVTGVMHWVSGDVYDGHNCVQTAFAVLRLPTDTYRVPFVAHACGAAGKPVPYTIMPLRRDPVYTPAKPEKTD